MLQKIFQFLSTYKKALFYRLLAYALFILAYYVNMVFMFEWKFIFQEYILANIVLVILIAILYWLWGLLDKIFVKKYINIWVKIMLLFFILFPVMITIFQIHRVKIGNIDEPNIYTHYDELTFETIDDKKINGWYLLNTSSDKTIIFAHGLWANRSNFLEYAKIFYNLGYNVFIFDFRWHGDSSGHTISFWFHESKDILWATQYIKNKYPKKTKNIYGVWFSMWGAAMIYAQSKYALFDKIIIDSSFAYSENMVNHVYKYLPTFYREYLKYISAMISKTDIWISIISINPADEIKNIQVPILLFHGWNDKLIPTNESKILFENISSQIPHNLFIFENSEHVAWIVDQDEKYNQIVQDFLRK